MRVTRKRDAEAWLRTGDARWSSDPELRRQRQAAGLCVVCGLARQDGRHWCCSREHEKLRRHIRSGGCSWREAKRAASYSTNAANVEAAPDSADLIGRRWIAGNGRPPIINSTGANIP